MVLLEENGESGVAVETLGAEVGKVAPVYQFKVIFALEFHVLGSCSALALGTNGRATNKVLRDCVEGSLWDVSVIGAN